MGMSVAFLKKHVNSVILKIVHVYIHQAGRESYLEQYES